MKRKVKGKVGEFALKVNISKAFDKVEREYLFALLLEMGFSLRRWVKEGNTYVLECKYVTGSN